MEIVCWKTRKRKQTTTARRARAEKCLNNLHVNHDLFIFIPIWFIFIYSFFTKKILWHTHEKRLRNEIFVCLYTFYVWILIQLRSWKKSLRNYRAQSRCGCLMYKQHFKLVYDLTILQFNVTSEGVLVTLWGKIKSKSK